ncbi:unnamed protein product [Nippostrongylus brasiliensis]|uniref:Palmitoyltransferase n=1 Tax=Nippostrongylus brasiliensis TaxID=27835 RepID=A0A0N4Y848_NIPBR|nr:unnamed protein product [Nippostrongylus brasiliensis]
MISRIPLDSLKWWASVIGWLAALASWFQIIIVLGLGRMEILSHQWKFFVFVGLWIIITCSYFNAVFTTAQPIPKEYHIEETDDEGVRNLEIRQKGGKLNIFSVCIHHHNHKFFLLFLLWPCCLGVFVTLITIPYTLRTAANLWMGGTLSSEHHLLNSAIMNAVSHEFSVFDLGSRLKNFRSIFGHSPLTWFMPTYTTPGDGVNYPYVVRRGSDIDGAGSPTPKKRFWEFW